MDSIDHSKASSPWARILELKKRKNALILAHYYQDPDIQDLADFIGDSLELAKRSAETKADMIVFCGVHFMAETAKILNPSKKVVIPDLKAGCSLADACPAEDLARWKKSHPDYAVVSYINCTAAVKALSDVIVTSSNAEKIIKSFPPDQKLLFAPDKNLGAYLSKKLNRPMELWNGACIVHEIFSEKKILQLKELYPTALVLAHPECEEPVLKHADFIGSTSKLLTYSQTSTATEFIVATESGILHQMRKASPRKTFIPAPPNHACACNECPYMKLNTLEKILACMESEQPEIILPEAIMDQARRPLTRMLELSL